MKPIDDLKNRPSYREDRNPSHPLTSALRDLVRDHGLHGAVLISFYDDRVGINSSSPSPDFASAMETLGDKILVAIDDGQFDPESPSSTTEGS